MKNLFRENKTSPLLKTLEKDFHGGLYYHPVPSGIWGFEPGTVEDRLLLELSLRAFLWAPVILVVISCCVFLPANGCSARRSLVEIDNN